ncbi:MAG: beta-eliminating lyase-related protein [Bdellovibrio sp.]
MKPENQRHFASDNQAPVHPEIFAALQKVNAGHTMSYGGDEITEEAQDLIQRHFGKEARPLFVFNGTAANVVALRALVDSHQSILASDVSHLNQDECGAPEFFVRSKILSIPSVQGKISVAALEESWQRSGDVHYPQPAALSLTQPTEFGTVYSIEELREILVWAKAKNLKIHIDGARFSNAVCYLKSDFKALAMDLGVDALSFGGTKNGMMFGEAVIVFEKHLQHRLRPIQKQSAQLPSKGRYVAAQFVAYFSSELWRRIATNSLARAQELYEHTKAIPSVRVLAPVQSNAVFVQLPRQALKALRQDRFFYIWNEKLQHCRWMCSWDTSSEDVRYFSNRLLELTMNSKERGP